MADISAELVKELRERTGAGFMDCKKALTEADGDLDKAIALLRERGLAAAAKKSGREAREGLVSSYIHTGGRVGVLIEVNCETDFVARTDEFQKLVRDLAVQVAGLAPLYVDQESHPGRGPRGQEGRAARRRVRPEEAREHPRPDRRGPAQEVVRPGLPVRPAVPRRGADRRRADHREDRDDRREHPRPPLHPLRARGGAVSDRRDDHGGPGLGAPLPPDPAQAVRRGAARRSAVRRRPRVLRVHRAPGRRGPSPGRPGRHRGRRRQHLPRHGRGGARAWTARPATTSACSRPS